MEGSLRIPEGWADEFRMTVADPRTFQPGQRICFESERPKNDFRIRLLVFPAGQSMDHGQDSRVSVYVELLLPPSATMGNRRWTREDVCVEVAVLYSETGPVSHSRVGWFAATELSQQAGLDDVVYLDDLEECLNEGQLHLCAKASIAPRHCGRREDVEMTLHHSEAHDAVPGQFLRSRRAGLPHNFMFDLQVYSARAARPGLGFRCVSRVVAGATRASRLVGCWVCEVSSSCLQRGECAHAFVQLISLSTWMATAEAGRTSSGWVHGEMAPKPVRRR